MKKVVLAVLALVFLMGSVVWAAEPTPSGIGKTVTLMDLDGTPTQFQQAYFPNAMGQNQMVVRINKIKQVFDPTTRRWHRESAVEYVNDKSGDGWGNKLVPAVGGGLAQSVPLAAGIVWGSKILRPDQTNVSAGNNSGNQSQGQTALGGSGGVGGAGGSTGPITNFNTALGGAGGAGGSVGNITVSGVINGGGGPGDPGNHGNHFGWFK